MYTNCVSLFFISQIKITFWTIFFQNFMQDCCKRKWVQLLFLIMSWGWPRVEKFQPQCDLSQVQDYKNRSKILNLTFKHFWLLKSVFPFYARIRLHKSRRAKIWTSGTMNGLVVWHNQWTVMWRLGHPTTQTPTWKI